MRENCRESENSWIGVVVETIFAIVGILFALRVFGLKRQFITGLFLTLFGGVVTIGATHEGTCEINGRM